MTVVPLFPDAETPPVSRHQSLEVYLAQHRITPTSANQDHWEWLSIVAAAQARELLADYEKTVGGLIDTAIEAGQLAAAGFLNSRHAGAAMRAALLSALADAIEGAGEVRSA